MIVGILEKDRLTTTNGTFRIIVWREGDRENVDICCEGYLGGNNEGLVLTRLKGIIKLKR